MYLSREHQELADFFADRELPTGPQHVNPYSVFFNLSGAVNARLSELHSDVDATRNAAALMLTEVKNWLTRPAAAIEQEPVHTFVDWRLQF